MTAFEECINIMNNSAVSDVIRVNAEDRKRLGLNPLQVDAGLMLANTIPITDMEIVVSYKDVGKVVGRIVVQPDFYDNYNVENDDGATGVLALAMVIGLGYNKRILVPMFVGLTTGRFVYYPEEEWYCVIDDKGKVETHYVEGQGEQLLRSIVAELLCWWHFIQVCLTNPPIRERFAALSKTKTVPKGDTKKKRGAVRYVKTHYLDPEEWGIIKRTESGRTYSCLAWYVIGHWREYKNGHRVFIKPYWKGTMRNSVEEAGDVSRNRIVAQMEKVIV